VNPLGKIIGLSSEDYHNHDAISHSRLEVFRKRPEKYYKQYIERSEKRAGSSAYDFGTAAHTLILEGHEKYTEETAVWTGGNKVKAKAAWEQFKEANAGKLIVSAEEDVAVFDVLGAVRRHPEASALLSAGEPEVSWRVKSSVLPLPLQCRTDWFNPNGCELTDGRPYILDLKTTESLDDDEYRNFQDSFVKYGYHRQAGFYMALLRDLGIFVSDFFFLAVEKTSPYGVDLFRITESAVQFGLTETLHDLERLSTCYATDTWPNRPAGINLIDVPQWYQKKAQALLA
jgi:hypothetical protein